MTQIELLVGKSYRAKWEGYSDSVDFGNGPEDFGLPERSKEFVVLTKPDRVIDPDGNGRKTMPLPEHLAMPIWYWVRDLQSGSSHWFCAKGPDSLNEI